jgi:hypothetical protein
LGNQSLLALNECGVMMPCIGMCMNTSRCVFKSWHSNRLDEILQFSEFTMKVGLTVPTNALMLRGFLIFLAL